MVKKYKCCFLMGFQKAIEYRSDFVLSLISSMFPIIIQVSLWTAVYSTTGSGMLYGYTYQQMIMYTFMVGVISKFLATGFEYEMNDDIKNGGLNKYAVKPINYYVYRVSCFAGERASASFLFLSVMAVLLFLFSKIGYFKIDLAYLCFFFLSLTLTLFLNFSIYFCVGMLGFWMSEIGRLFPAVGIIFNVISGGVFPLDILGETWNRILRYLPIKYMLQFPVDVVTGKMTVGEILFAVAVQCFWVVFFMALSNLLWKKGIRKYTATGG